MKRRPPAGPQSSKMSFKMSRMKSGIAIFSAAVLCMSLAACTEDSQETSTGGTVSTQQPPPTESQQAANPGTGIIKSTAMNSCTTEPGNVIAKGVVTQPADTPGNVQISVSWVDAKTSAVLTKGQVLIEDAEAGVQREWTIQSELKATDVAVSCVVGATVLPK